MGGGSGSDETRPGAADSGARDRSERPVRAVPSARASAEDSGPAKSARKSTKSAASRGSAASRSAGPRRGGSRRPASGRRFDRLRKRPRFRLTRRAGILALALCTVMVTVAYPLQEYLAQRSRIAAQNAQNAQTAAQIAQLKKQLAKWSDPNYVEIQARERLHYVMPGEIGFIVPSTAGSSEPLGMPSPSAQPWYDNLWSTLKSPSPSATGGSASPSPVP
ncbi:MAG TPA: septum formation initiator family protein [Actinocrinis sp.]